MEFWIGLSVGMHLGRVIAEYLEKLSASYGLLTPKAIQRIDKLESAEGKVCSIIDEAEE